MRSLIILAVSAASLIAGAASAQQRVNLSAGFLPDPVAVDVYSGGGEDASNLGGSCVGSISGSPDVVVYFDSAGGTLSFTVDSSGDTSLVINGPDGRNYCNDDSNGLNPVLTWGSAPSGQYDVWIGAVGESASGTLLISESGF